MMNFAIIAAGDGSRLKNDGITISKPLVRVNGKPLLNRLITLFENYSSVPVSLIINNEMSDVLRYVETLQQRRRINLIVRSTPSSMHSFAELSRFLTGGKFCLTTVDTVFQPSDFSRFIRAFENDEDCDGMFAITKFTDDEKPLYVSVNEQDMTITGFYDEPHTEAKYVSGGIYGLTPKSLQTLNRCLQTGQSRMRSFQRQLLADGLKIKAFPFDKIIDLDHASDIAKAEELVRPLNLLAVSREERFSPGHIEDDEAILNSVIEALKTMDCEVERCSEKEFLTKNLDADLVFGMARDSLTVEKLQEVEQKGLRIVNSGFGIGNCIRENMAKHLIDNGIPYPKSIFISTDEDFVLPDDFKTDKFWVKKSSYFADCEDVVFAHGKEQLVDVIKKFRECGIRYAVVNEHIEGDLLKFYGVADSGFFYWFYPTNKCISGLSLINGKALGTKFDVNNLELVCRKAAEILNIKIFGGDCIVRRDGTLCIIDFNDWPSFAVCRDEAAPAIANCIYESAKRKR
ncbi:MAG: NTP transferase domain-containing protein [Dysgonamonadaceae bacterium]|jgi:dTDP-glucose pyrophosphorylase|nr:NTP transferase domain-containing protein [Dysgonamonadaceae bacterium]